MIRFMGYPAGIDASRISLFAETAAAYGYHVSAIMPGYPQAVPDADLENQAYGLHIFPDLDTAHAAYTALGHTLVFLYAGEPNISTFTHPLDKVIYCVGDDITGFSKTLAELQAMGTTLSNNLANSAVLDGTLSAQLAMADRFTRM